MRLERLAGLPSRALLSLADALDSGRLAWPPTAAGLRARSFDDAAGIAKALSALTATFADGATAGAALRLLGEERHAAEQAAHDRVDLVWSGPEVASESLDTAVVVQDLFRTAERSVVVSTYNLSTPELLAPLVAHKRREPGFEVRLFLHIDAERALKYARAGEGAVDSFRRFFIGHVWPDAPLPEVYYDPRSIDDPRGPRLHAKCVIADEARALITSANLSEAAHNDNVEAGVLVRDAAVARVLARKLVGLIERREVERLV